MNRVVLVIAALTAIAITRRSGDGMYPHIYEFLADHLPE
jgi:hypothetical protein